jgi:methyltransferase (TIGR00027 family)
MEAAPSRTAMVTALARGEFRLDEEPPWVLDDPFALVLIGPAWQPMRERIHGQMRRELRREGNAFGCARARYAEDRLRGGAFTQYVILGAGLDSFAWRRPDLLRSLRVYEVDHPASQAWKIQRVDELGLPRNASQVFVPVDLEVQSLQDGLSAAGLDWAQRTLFSWLGVTLYLTAEAIESTLRTIAKSAAGSEVALSYRTDDSVLDDPGREFTAIIAPVVAAAGEPLQAGWTAAAIERLVARCGLSVVDHPTRADLAERYFSGRADGLRPYTVETLLTAVVG